MTYRIVYFSQETVQTGGRKEWLRSLSRSCGKYAFFSHITESQLQQYLSAKYEQFLKQQETGQFSWPCIKLAAKEVGLQEFEKKDLAEIGVAEHAPRVWVLNFHLHVVEDSRPWPAEESPHIYGIQVDLS